MTTTSTVGLTHCPNCDTMLEGRFCAQCGQKAAPLNPSIGDLLHDLFHELAHFDGKIVQSVARLLTRPGFLSREHFAGRRARYVAPIRLYLIFSLLYFAVASLAPVTMLRITYTPGANERPDLAEQRRQELQHLANEVVSHWAPRAMFVLVPVFAGLVALTTRRSGRNYPQHLYFAMHLHAAWFFAGAVNAAAQIANVPYLTPLVGSLIAVYAMVYFVLAFRRTYGLTTGGALWRAAVTGFTYSLIVLVVLIVIVIPAMPKGNP